MSPNYRWAVLMGLAAAAAFAGIASINLTAQGAYYDELHQAPAAFAHRGIEPQMFCVAKIGSVPLFTLSYGGAIKSNCYGLYLRWGNRDFDLLSWRLLGIMFVVVGILAFSVVAGPMLTPAGMATFLFLLLSDVGVILGTRHDWGPVALGLTLRMLLIGLWLRGELAGTPSRRNTFLVSFITGIAIYEKVVAVVLLPFLIAVVIRRTIRGGRRHAWVGGGGLLLGSLPLVALNVHTLLAFGHLVTARAVWVNHPYSLAYVFGVLSRYLSLGTGGMMNGFILGAWLPAWQPRAEALTMIALVAVSLFLCLRFRHKVESLRLVSLLLLGYGTIGVILALMPRSTAAHHFSFGTPFHYVALALVIAGLGERRARLGRSLVWLAVILAALVPLRVVGVVGLVRNLAEGRSSLSWDPSLNRWGEFAASKADEALFLIADWGVGTQVYCYTGGRPGVMDELFPDYGGLDHLRRSVQSSGKREWYLAAKRPRSEVTPATTERIYRDAQLLSEWQRVPCEEEIADLAAVEVMKFIPAGEAGPP